MMKRSIPAGEFKAKCLGLMDELRAEGGEIVVTKRGRPVARILPPQPLEDDSYLSLVGTVHYEDEDDFVGPSGMQWPGEDDEDE